MSRVFVGEVGLSILRLLQVYCDTSYEVSITIGRSRYIFPSRCKNGFLRIVRAEYNGQLGVVYPPLFPIDLWLVSGEPRVP